MNKWSSYPQLNLEIFNYPQPVTSDKAASKT